MRVREQDFIDDLARIERRIERGEIDDSDPELDMDSADPQEVVLIKAISRQIGKDLYEMEIDGKPVRGHWRTFNGRNAFIAETGHVYQRPGGKATGFSLVHSPASGSSPKPAQPADDDEEHRYNLFLGRLDPAGLQRERARLTEKHATAKTERKPYWLQRLTWVDERLAEESGAIKPKPPEKPAQKATTPPPAVPPAGKGTARATRSSGRAAPASGGYPPIDKIIAEPDYYFEKATPGVLTRLQRKLTSLKMGPIKLMDVGEAHIRSQTKRWFNADTGMWMNLGGRGVTPKQAELRIANKALHALDRLTSIVKIPGDKVGGKPNLKITITADLDKTRDKPYNAFHGAAANYSPQSNQINLDVRHVNGLFHEFGHYIDYGIAQGRNDGTYRMPASELPGSVQDFVKELQRTDTHYEFAKRAGLQANYMLSNREVFARFFDGWILHEMKKRGINGSCYSNLTMEPYSYAEFERFGRKLRSILRSNSMMKAVLFILDRFSA